METQPVVLRSGLTASWLRLQRSLLGWVDDFHSLHECQMGGRWVAQAKRERKLRRHSGCRTATEMDTAPKDSRFRITQAKPPDGAGDSQGEEATEQPGVWRSHGDGGVTALSIWHAGGEARVAAGGAAPPHRHHRCPRQRPEQPAPTPRQRTPSAPDPTPRRTRAAPSNCGEGQGQAICCPMTR